MLPPYTNWYTLQNNLWKDEPCFILGGGPTLKQFDCDYLKDKGRTIAINNAGISIARWADIFFWADKRWYDWNQGLFHKYTGPLKLTRQRRSNVYACNTSINIIRYDPGIVLSDTPNVIGGNCGGSSAINIAYLLGANPIYLFGFDMSTSPTGEGNWHNQHKVEAKAERYKKNFIPTINTMETLLTAQGKTVINVTTRSALKCFPKIDFDEFKQRI